MISPPLSGAKEGYSIVRI